MINQTWVPAPGVAFYVESSERTGVAAGRIQLHSGLVPSDEVWQLVVQKLTREGVYVCVGQTLPEAMVSAVQQQAQETIDALMKELTEVRAENLQLRAALQSSHR